MAIYRELNRTARERKRVECFPMAPALRSAVCEQLAWFEPSVLTLRVEYPRAAGEITGAKLNGSLGQEAESNTWPGAPVRSTRPER